jgi:CrcB protein
VASLGFTLSVVAVGGAVGAVARFTLSAWFNRLFDVHHTVHIGTLLVNVLGSFIMGLVYVYIVEREVWHPELKGLIMVGMLGAFTTFSSFSLEAINFFEQGHPWLSACYVLGSVFLCLGAVTLAIALARYLLS